MSIWLIPLVVSGPALIAGFPAGFYALAFAMVLMFGFNVYNAWVLIAENTD